jgi:hypothetical protein
MATTARTTSRMVATPVNAMVIPADVAHSLLLLNGTLPPDFSHLGDVVTYFTSAAHVSATLSNVVGMISTEAGLRRTQMKVQWCVSPVDILPIS